jgi:phosphoserine phosphatase
MTTLRAAPLYASVILDVDSTVAGLEGIDWLARQRGEDVAAAVRELTEASMDGRIPLDEVYGSRLDVIRPSLADLRLLSAEYLGQVAPGARDAIHRMREAGVRVAFVSGGLRQAVLPLVQSLGARPDDLHAVTVILDGNGDYLDFDRTSPLTTQEGKRDAVESLSLPRPSLMVGDGATDLAARDSVDAFAAYTGFVRRQAVVDAADLVVESWDQLLEVVFRREE